MSQSSATPLETHQEEEGMGLVVPRLDTDKLSPTTLSPSPEHWLGFEQLQAWNPTLHGLYEVHRLQVRREAEDLPGSLLLASGVKPVRAHSALLSC